LARRAERSAGSGRSFGFVPAARKLDEVVRPLAHFYEIHCCYGSSADFSCGLCGRWLQNRTVLPENIYQVGQFHHSAQQH
jgi:hypothetical protein